ncbi:AAA ATPase domain-containing protein [Streptomyces sp. WMMB 714]|uniref:helix-turn-helix transcriptional regulator n=1 Tax=Streptomyces sp. WMMB 714 TaxID=1286822 RepID=UPI000823DDD0|nr:LuxR family transcriptional regulator [Streptomyces sp. WMMB 714]SCK11552.1 AAA ATPase domain-containing protein [Streptomyces sp. WMMB 714]
MGGPSPWPFVGREPAVAQFDEALAGQRCQALIVHGSQGTGKSRLAQVCRERAEERGHAAGRAVPVHGHPVPLASLAHLLPPGSRAGDPVALFRATREALTEECASGAAGKRFVLVADDLDGLDEASASLVGQLAEAGALFLVGTVTSLPSLGPAAYALQANGAARRVDLAGLDEPQVADVMRQALGGPVEPRTAALMHRTSGGNARCLREFVRASLDGGSLVHDGESWTLVSEVPAAPVLAELLERRLASVGPETRRTLDRIALCQPVEAAGLPGSAMDELERLDLVTATRDGRRESVSLKHPAHEKVLRSLIPSSARRRILNEEAELVASRGARRLTDKIRIASWQLAATGSADPDTLLRAATLARRTQDFRQVCELSKAACRDSEELLPRLLLAESLYELGDLDSAREVFEDAASRAEGELDRLLVALGRARLLAWGFIDGEAALEVSAEAMERIGEPAYRDVLTAVRGAVFMAFGRPEEALQALHGLSLDGNRMAGLFGKGPRAAALVATGSAKRGLVLAREAYDERLGLEDSLGVPHPVQYLNTVMFALEEEGRLDEAYRTGEKGWAEALAGDAAGAQAWIAAALARCALLRGRPREARRWASQAVSVAARNSLVGTLHVALARKAEAAALLRDVPAARKALDACEELPHWGAFRSELPLGRAWSAAAQGNVQESRKVLWEAVANARAAGHRASESRLLTDIARLGDAAGAAGPLLEIRRSMDGALVAARAAYVSALADGHARRLLESARLLADAGAALPAAEAAASAAVQFGRDGEQRAATAAENLALSLQQRCAGASTPGLSALGVAKHLTAREAEIARLVCAGLTNAEVAEAVTISKRTVDNHVQNIYRKLGVSSRRALRAEYLREESA